MPIGVPPFIQKTGKVVAEVGMPSSKKDVPVEEMILVIDAPSKLLGSTLDSQVYEVLPDGSGVYDPTIYLPGLNGSASFNGSNQWIRMIELA